YGIEHDTSRPVDVFIQEIVSAAAQLKSLGCTVEETEITDVILMRLDPSYHNIRATILSQKTSPTIEKIKIILASATSA
ncbi:hypothetical protein P691DRAFT_612559, partial [Macrolepiota fuliginosa MF-IS2]